MILRHIFGVLIPLQFHPQIGCANEELARAEAMFELTRDWVRERKAFGRRVADLQTVSFSPFKDFKLPLSGSAQVGRAEDIAHCVPSFPRLLPRLAQQLQAGQRDVQHGQVLGHRLAEQGCWRLLAASWRFFRTFPPSIENSTQ